MRMKSAGWTSLQKSRSGRLKSKGRAAVFGGPCSSCHCMRVYLMPHRPDRKRHRQAIRQGTWAPESRAHHPVRVWQDSPGLVVVPSQVPVVWDCAPGTKRGRGCAKPCGSWGLLRGLSGGTGAIGILAGAFRWLVATTTSARHTPRATRLNKHHLKIAHLYVPYCKLPLSTALAFEAPATTFLQ